MKKQQIIFAAVFFLILCLAVVIYMVSTYDKMEELMMNTQMLTKDVGTILVGKEAVDVGLINEIGGIADAFKKLKKLIKDAK